MRAEKHACRTTSYQARRHQGACVIGRRVFKEWRMPVTALPVNQIARHSAGDGFALTEG
jgi:hypothetical protein